MAPTTITKTGSDARSFTFQANDGDGIYRVEAWYTTADYRDHRSIGRSAANCPASFTVTFPRHLTVRGRRAPLKDVTVFDCSHIASGSHEQTTFGADGRGNLEQTRVGQMPHHVQRFREGLQQFGDRLDQLERRQKQMLLLLLLLLLLTIWAALGPVFL